MDFSVNDWIRHAKFGDGQIAEDRGDKLVVRFPAAGDKVLLKSAIIGAGDPPYAGFSFPKSKATGRRRFKIERPKQEARLEFDHLIKRFLDVFQSGFDDKRFEDMERRYKAKAVDLLAASLGSGRLSALVSRGDIQEVCDLAMKILQATNLAFPQEKIRLNDSLKRLENQRLFAPALQYLLYGAAPIEHRFANFADVLGAIGASSWTVATYYQFLETRGKLMFMKPAVTKKMALSLGIALNYKPEPNWLAYSKLQEMSDKLGVELEKRGLRPKSGLDIQGFIWTSIKIEEGKYGSDGISV